MATRWPVGGKGTCSYRKVEKEPKITQNRDNEVGVNGQLDQNGAWYLEGNECDLGRATEGSELKVHAQRRGDRGSHSTRGGITNLELVGYSRSGFKGQRGRPSYQKPSRGLLCYHTSREQNRRMKKRRKEIFKDG